MLEISYPASFRPDEDGRPVVRFIDLREALTDGTNMTEAWQEAQDCLGSALAQRMANKEEIPYPSKPKRGQKAVPVPLWMAPKVALYWAMKESGIERRTREEIRRAGNRHSADARSGPRNES